MLANSFIQRAIATLLALALVSLSSCATVFSDSVSRVRLDSDPQGAEAKLYDGKGGGIRAKETTPAEFRIDWSTVPFARNDLYVELNSPGYETKRIMVRKTLNWITVVNILFWPLFLVDVGTGAMWQAERDSYYVELEKEGAK